MKRIRQILAVLLAVSMVACYLPQVVKADEGSYQHRFWDVDSLTAESTFPSHQNNNTGDRGSVSFTAEDEAGLAGSRAFVMTVTAPNDNSRDTTGILNGTKSGEKWANAGVTGFSTPRAIQSGDIVWVWVSNQMGQDEYAKIELYNGSKNYSLNTGKTLYTITEDDNGLAAITTVPANGTVGSITYANTARGPIRVADGGSGWVGFKAEDCVVSGAYIAAGDTLYGLYLYSRSISGGNGTVGGRMIFDEFWLTSAGTMPALENGYLLGKTVKSAAIDTLPASLICPVNGTPDVTGGRIAVTYTDDTAAVVDMTSSMISCDTSSIGTKTVTVDYFGTELTYDITVKNTPVSAVWSSKPTKAVYAPGEALDVTGGELLVSYDDGTDSTIALTSDMVSGFDTLNTGIQTLTVSYESFTLTYDVEVTAEGGSRALLWDLNKGGDYVFPGSDRDSGANNVDKRGRMDYSIENKGFGGSSAFVMTVAETSTNAGILNGTLAKQNWATAGVTGFAKSAAVSENDIFWLWVDNEMGEDEFIVVEFVYGTANTGTSTVVTRSNVLYTISGGRITELAPGSTIGGFRNYNGTTRGAILADDGASGWIGIPLYDITALRGKTIDGFRIYTRSFEEGNNSLANNGTVGKYVVLDGFWVCPLGLLPLDSVTLAQAPSKTSYQSGEAPDTAGGKLTAVFMDGETKTVDITTDMVSGYDPAAVGTQTLTVSYMGERVTFDVTVAEDQTPYRQRLVDFDALDATAVLPTPDTANSSRGTTSVSLEPAGLLGSNALALTVATASTDAGIQNGVTDDWNAVTGFTQSRQIRSGDIFWMWIDNEYSADQYIVAEFGYSAGGTLGHAGTPTSSGSDTRTIPLYTIAEEDGAPAIVTIAAGESVNGITNSTATRGVIIYAAGTKGWVGIPLDGITGNHGVLWGAAIEGVRLYTRNTDTNSATNAANGVPGESIYMDEPWVTSAGLMPDLSDEVLLNKAADVMKVELGSVVTADLYITPDVAVGTDDQVVFRAAIGGDTSDIIGIPVENGQYLIRIDDIYANQYTDLITGSVVVDYADSTDDHVIRTYTESDGLSIAAYCDKLVAQYPDDTELINLISDLLLYGTEVQLYKGYRTDDLPSAGRTWIESGRKTFAIPDSQFSVDTPAADKSAGYISGANLRISEKVAVMFTVRTDNAASAALRITFGDTTETVDLTDSSVLEVGEGKYKVVLDKILPQEYSKKYAVQLLIGTETVHAVSYSVDSYINRMQDSTVVGSLVRALNDYGQAAAAYVSTH
ncbi:MAG: bacterial Ig-like domain-containing protein [Lachnospiraceae bacterium]|nr:bacterial Ig-like domain-containing protein [Lachnospiraceae bacterium]